MELTLGNTPEIMQTTYKAVDAIQTKPGATQAQAVAVLFVSVAKAIKKHPIDLVELADKIMRDGEHVKEFQALQDYVKNEIADHV